MSLLNKGKALSSLRALRRRVPLGALPQVQPIFLLQTLIGLSQALNGSAAQLEVLARALVVDGQERLRRLRNSAPQLHLPLERFLESVQSKQKDSEALSEEESAVQAMLQVLLGLMLQWLSKRRPRSHLAVSFIASRLFRLFDALFPSCCLTSPLPRRIRACPIFQAP